MRAEAKSSTELVVTWEPPPRESWNGNLLGYHVGYQEVTESHSQQQQGYTLKSVEVRPHFGGEATLQGLTKYTTYNIVVKVSLKLCLINPKIMDLQNCLDVDYGFECYFHQSQKICLTQSAVHHPDPLVD